MAGIALVSLRESLVHQNLHVNATVQGTSLGIIICCCRMCRAVSSGSDDSTQGDISLLKEVVGDRCGAIFAELLVELFCPSAGGVAGYFD